jgi:hypothetical protein
MRQALAASWAWSRVQLFRLWTALTVVGACGYLWLYEPEYLTWWKRSIDALVEAGCAQLPYPWGDRIESTIGNFGIWVQLTLAVLIFPLLLAFCSCPLGRCVGDEGAALRTEPAHVERASEVGFILPAREQPSSLLVGRLKPPRGSCSNWSDSPQAPEFAPRQHIDR